LLFEMDPELHEGEFVFCSVPVDRAVTSAT